MRLKKTKLVALTGLALMLAPTFSTVGVTGADDLNSGKAAITQAVPLKSTMDRAIMTSIDGQISAAITAQR
jgi:hypothetical protein